MRAWLIAALGAVALSGSVLAVEDASAAPTSWTLSVLHDSCHHGSCKDGYEPQGPLLRHSSDTFYGTMHSDDNLAGNVFQVKYDPARGKWIYHRIHNFCYCAEGGRGPFSNLIEDVNGNLYGITGADGAHGAGTVYELLPNADRTKWTFQVLHNFPDADGDGRYPGGGLTYAGAGTGALYDGVSPLYGSTFSGGNQDDQGDGVVYSLTPGGGSWSESVLHTFCSQANCADGKNPIGPLGVDAAGNVFGVTENGGNGHSGGIAFEISGGPGAWTESVLHAFCAMRNCADGIEPSNGVLVDAAGNVFGTTIGGGTGHKNAGGVLFRLVPAGEDTTYSVLYSFCQRRACADGAYPRSTLAFDASGNIYGATYEGGTGNDGTIFQFNGTGVTTLYRFCTRHNCTDGYNPQGVTWDPSGNLFGTTYDGGTQGMGTVFELSPPGDR